MCKRIVSGYLLEKKLSEEVEAFAKCQNYVFLGNQIRLDGNRRWPFDCGIKINDRKILFEFDGDRHYTDGLVFYRDIQKTVLAKSEGFEVIRFPFWIQLNTETLSYYLNMKISNHEIVTTFPHGFIADKATLPSSFCVKGYQRFVQEFESLPSNIICSVLASLKYQSEKRNIPYKYIAGDIPAGITCDEVDFKKCYEYINAYEKKNDA